MPPPVAACRSRHGTRRETSGAAARGQVHDGLLAQGGARQVAGHAALVQHQHAVAHAEHLFQVARNHDDGDAGRRRGRPSGRRSRCGRPRPRRASARRRSARAAAAPATCPAPPSAGCRRTAGRRSGSGPEPRTDSRALRSRVRPRSRDGTTQPSGPSVLSRTRLGSEKLPCTVSVRTRPCRRRSSGASSRPARMASRGWRTRSGTPSSRTSPPVTRRRPNSASASLGAAGADQPRHADDFAAAHGERGRQGRAAGEGQAAHLQAHGGVGRRLVSAVVEALEVAADHEADHRVAADLFLERGRRRCGRRAAPRRGRPRAAPRPAGGRCRRRRCRASSGRR